MGVVPRVEDVDTQPSEPGWAAAGLLRRAALRLNAGWREASTAAHREWWTATLAGFVVLEALVLTLVGLGWWAEATGLLAWEADVVRWFGDRSPVPFAIAIWLDGLGNVLVLWTFVLLAAGVAAWRRQTFRALALLVGFTALHPAVLTGWFLWTRDRPALIAEGLAAPGGLFSSYPSGHVALTVVAYGLLGWLWSRDARSRVESLAALALPAVPTALVSLGRLRLGAHWPSDIAASIVLGAVWVMVLATIVGRVERTATGPTDPGRANG